MFQATEAKLKTCGLVVLTYQNYCQAYGQNHLSDSSKDELVISNQFQELPDEEPLRGDENDDDVNEDYDDDGFVEVNRGSEQRKRRFEKDEEKLRAPCIWGLYCQKELDCRYGHTDGHRDHFKSYGHKQLKKYKLCKNEGCLRGPKQCRFAHGMRELLCPTCDKVGKHGMEDCPKKKWP